MAGIIILVEVGALSTRVAIVIDNMYLQTALHTFGIKALDMAKLPQLLIDEERNEEYHTTHVFDALPFVPKENPKPFQIANRDRKRKYLDKLQYLDRVEVYEGKVWQKHIICPKCNQSIEVAVQKLVDVKISVVLLRLSLSKIVDKIILVAGDSDLIPAVEVAGESGTIIQLCYMRNDKVKTASSLIRTCTESRELEKPDLEKCALDKF